MDTRERIELAEELRRANEESARLSEMIALLGDSLVESSLRQLRIELLIINRRAIRLAEELAGGKDSSAAA